MHKLWVGYVCLSIYSLFFSEYMGVSLCDCVIVWLCDCECLSGCGCVCVNACVWACVRVMSVDVCDAGWCGCGCDFVWMLNEENRDTLDLVVKLQGGWDDRTRRVCFFCFFLGRTGVLTTDTMATKRRRKNRRMMQYIPPPPFSIRFRLTSLHVISRCVIWRERERRKKKGSESLIFLLSFVVRKGGGHQERMSNLPPPPSGF